MAILQLSGKRPKDLGVRAKMLTPCPQRPNCVSSQADAGDARHIAPFSFSPTVSETVAMLVEILTRMKGVTIVTHSEGYIHAECKTRMGFVDDLEFYWHPEERVCHVRSASRRGYSDFGKNRRRVEAIRRRCLEIII